MLNAPVLFLVFNRPDTTARVFEEIRSIQPKQLFIASDGPRSNHSDDVNKCEQVRKITEQVDWACEVKTLFREHNLGCKYAVSSAIDWFFGQVEEGIILEDDTIPDPTFFRYCADLLVRYREAEKVMHISGVNFQFGNKRGPTSYYFSRYAHVWGWASWRRAWKHYDVEMNGLADFVQQQKLELLIASGEERNFWLDAFRQMAENKVDTWDTQWLYAIWKQNGICITPNVNLISNIGFGAGATHTVQLQSKLANMPTKSMSFALKHPLEIVSHQKADEYVFTHAIHIKPTTFEWVKNHIRSLFPKAVGRKITASYNGFKKAIT